MRDQHRGRRGTAGPSDPTLLDRVQRWWHGPAGAPHGPTPGNWETILRGPRTEQIERTVGTQQTEAHFAASAARFRLDQLYAIVANERLHGLSFGSATAGFHFVKAAAIRFVRIASQQTTERPPRAAEHMPLYCAYLELLDDDPKRGKLWSILRLHEPYRLVQVWDATPLPNGTLPCYWLRVAPTITSAHDGVAASWGLRPECYDPACET